jgi:hypothetical protein
MDQAPAAVQVQAMKEATMPRAAEDQIAGVATPGAAQVQRDCEE